jgi:hypothetical protein
MGLLEVRVDEFRVGNERVDEGRPGGGVDIVREAQLVGIRSQKELDQDRI